jgi:hypothetical protein
MVNNMSNLESQNLTASVKTQGMTLGTIRADERTAMTTMIAQDADSMVP